MAIIHIHPATINTSRPKLIEELERTTGLAAVLKKDGRALLIKLKQRSTHTEQTAC